MYDNMKYKGWRANRKDQDISVCAMQQSSSIAWLLYTSFNPYSF